MEFRIKTEGLKELVFEKDALVLKEGDRGKGRVLILKSGAVAIVAGGTEICRVNEPMTIFGEISALLDTEHSANVVAVEKTVCWVVENLLDFVKANPEAALHVAAVLASRLVAMNHHFLEIKSEVMKQQASQSTPPAKRGPLYQLIVKMDAFWGSDVFSLNPQKL